MHIAYYLCIYVQKVQGIVVEWLFLLRATLRGRRERGPGGIRFFLILPRFPFFLKERTQKHGNVK